MSAQNGPAPGFAKHPEHQIVLEPTSERVRVSAGDSIIADSLGAITVHEANYPPVQYLPLEDVRSNLLVDSDRQTYCPFKGKARYWHIALPDGGQIDDAVWGYPEPYAEMIELEHRVAFYPNKVEILIA